LQKQEQEQEQESITEPENFTTAKTQAGYQVKSKQEQDKAPAAATSCNTSNVMKSLFLYVQLSWDFAHSCLYNNKFFDEIDIDNAKKFIAMFFEPTSKTEIHNSQTF